MRRQTDGPFNEDPDLMTRVLWTCLGFSTTTSGVGIRDRLRWATTFAIDRYFIKQPRVRRAVTLALEGNSDRVVEVCGTRLTLNTVAEHGYLRVARIGERSSLLRDELPVILNLALLLDARDTFVDVGANVGFYAKTMARLGGVSDQFCVYAFEANPSTFRRLVQNLPDNVKAEQFAISDTNGSLDFVEGGVSHLFHVAHEGHSGKTVTVPCRRLDACNIQGDALVVKVDVEGHEKQVLAGARALFDAGRVKAVYVDGYTDKSIVPMLKSFGFALHDGRTMLPAEGFPWSLLALNPQRCGARP